MIEVELPNTTGPSTLQALVKPGSYNRNIAMYKEWFEKNNISYKIIGKEFYKNDKVLLTENDALLFRLRFGI